MFTGAFYAVIADVGHTAQSKDLTSGDHAGKDIAILLDVFSVLGSQRL